MRYSTESRITPAASVRSWRTQKVGVQRISEDLVDVKCAGSEPPTDQKPLFLMAKACMLYFTSSR